MSETETERIDSVRAQIDNEVIESANDVGIDVDAVIGNVIESRGDYGPKTIATFASGSLRDQVEAEKADEVTGIVAGTRDWAGSEGPRRISILRSNGDHLELSSFDGELPGPDGEDVRIPSTGAIATFRCSWNEQYENFDAKGIQSVKPLNTPELVNELQKVVERPSELKATSEGEVVAVKGQIAFVDEVEELEQIGDEWQVTERYDVVQSDERGKPVPHVQISLDRDDRTVVRGEIDKQRYGTPLLEVEDFEALAVDALDMGGPQEQSNFLQDALQGREVIFVGQVFKYDEATTSDDELRKYVNMSLSAIIETDLDEAQQTVESASSEPEPQPEPDPESEDEGDDRTWKDVRDDIEQYADLSGEDIDDLTVADVKDALNLDYPDVVIDAALSGEPPGDADSSDGGEDYAAIKEGGVFQCPVETDGTPCPASAGSIAELSGHIYGEHDIGEPAQGWLKENYK